MIQLNVTDSPKMLRETLATAQSRIGNSVLDRSRKEEHIGRLQRLIDECDRHRPLGVDGKHGNLHTSTCGCEDKGPRSAWDLTIRQPGITNLVDEVIRSYDGGAIRLLVILKEQPKVEAAELRSAINYLIDELERIEDAEKRTPAPVIRLVDENHDSIQ